MHIFFRDMEKLLNRGSNGYNGSIFATFPNTKALFVNIIYRNRSITYTFQPAILKSLLKPVKKNFLVSIHWLHERCGKSEEAHAVMKDDLAGGKLPSEDFGENAAWWWILVLLYFHVIIY